jgi:outer membrane protein OmpA-like peptidoglycan-associated protein
MTEQKRKSTRSFNLNKSGSSGEFDLNKEVEPKILERNNKFLKPIIIVAILALIVFGYFVLKPGGGEIITKAGNPTQPAQDAISSPQTQSPIVASGQLTEPNVPNAVTSENKTGAQSANSLQSTPQPKETKSLPDLPYKKGQAYRIYQFPFGDANYSQTNPELDKLVDAMKNNSSMKISIAAYTDNVGDVNYNQQLSEQRAKAILNYLVSRGIEQNRISSQGKGVSTDFSSNAENRRAEFILS